MAKNTDTSDEQICNVEKVAVYPLGELARGAYATFNTNPEVVRAALSVKGMQEATIDEARGAIKEFLETEVKI